MPISKSKAADLLRRISKLRIVVVGDAMLDHYLWGDATRISPEAPVPVVDVQRESHTAGGAGNVALNIASLGANCRLAAYIGADDAGRKLGGLLEKHAVGHVALPGTAPTIVKTRVVVQHQQLCRLDRESSPAAYRVEPRKLEAVLAREIAAADAVILSDYAKGVLDDKTVAGIAALCRKHDVLVALDPKPRHSLHFTGLDLITPNRREAAQLAGVELSPHAPFPAEEICRRLHERYHTKNVVITLSEDGLLLSSGGSVLKQIPTAAREVFDVSGAGDTSIAALVLALAAGANLETAGHFANAAAGVVVGKLGTASVTPAELIEHLGK